MAESPFLRAAAWNSLHGGVEGYNLPYDSSLNSLVYIGSGFNRFIGVWYSLTWIVATILMMVVIVAFTQRVLFAWSMDRMAPRWLANVSPRWGQPINGYAFLTIAGASLMIVYTLWLRDAMGALVASGLMLCTVFLATGISAIVFPYRKKVRTLWESSPYSKWGVLGVPVITIAGVVYVAFILVLLYFAFLDSRSRDLTGRNVWFFPAVWGFGLAWYYFWKYLAARREINADISFGQLPPE